MQRLTSCWFTDPARVAGQAALRAYGPVPSDPNRFRWAAGHVGAAGGGEVPAFAALSGRLLALADSDDHLTLILIPDGAPLGAGLRVAAVIYRKVLRASLLAADGTVADAAETELTAQIKAWEERQSPVPEPPDGTLFGLVDPPPAAETSLDEVARGALGGATGVPVRVGLQIGKFDPAGFEVAIAAPRHGGALTLGHLSAAEAVLTVPPMVDPDADPGAAFLARQAREAALDWIDPAAFFGALAPRGLRLRGAADPEPRPPSLDVYAGEVLPLLAFPDRVWLDFRGPAGASADHDLRDGALRVWVTCPGAPDAEFTPYESGWPLIPLDASHLAGAASGGDPASPEVGLGMAFNGASRFQQSLHMAHAISADASTWPDPAQSDPAFRGALSAVEGTDWSEAVAISLLLVPGQAEPIPLPNLLSLRLCRTFDYAPLDSPGGLAHPLSVKHIDGLFPLSALPASAPGIGEAGVVIRYGGQPHWVEDATFTPEPVLVAKGMGVDGTLVAFVAHVIDRDSPAFGLPPSVPFGDADVAGDDTLIGVLGQHFGDVAPVRVSVRAPGRIASLLTLVPKELQAAGSVDERTLIGLTITRHEYDGLLVLADAEGLLPDLPRLIGARRVDDWSDVPASQIRADGWELVMRGYRDTGGGPARHEVPTGIVIEVPSRTEPGHAAVSASAGAADSVVSAPMSAAALWPIPQDRKLRSALFEGDVEMELIGTGFARLRSGDSTFAAVGKLQAALRIVLMELETVPHLREAVRNWHPDGLTFDAMTADWLARFQEISTSEVPNFQPESGVLHRETLLLLDGQLDRIRYYISEPVAEARVVHNASNVRELGVLTVALPAPGGAATVQAEPRAAATPLIDLAFNESVLIQSIVPANDGSAALWCLVSTERVASDNDALPVHGYMRLADLHTAAPMPDPFARLHRVTVGETPDDIVSLYYPALPDTAPSLVPGVRVLDKRYYVNVLLFANNPEGDEMRTSRALDSESGSFVPGAKEPAPIWTDVDLGDLLDEIWDALWLGATQGVGNFSLNPIQQIIDTLADDRTWAAWADIAAFTQAWHNAVLEPGQLLWVPSREMADSLYMHVDSGSLTTDLATAFAETAFSLLDDDTIDELEVPWPVGFGVKIGGTLGATFGIPLAEDAEGEVTLWRHSQDEIRVLRWGEMAGAVDVGVGVGAYLGIGRRPSGKWYQAAEEDAGVGIGAVIGAQFTAGVRKVIVEELSIPFRDIPAIALVIRNAANVERSPGKRVEARILAHRIMSMLKALNLRDDEYRTKLKLRGDVFATGAAAGSAGLRFGKADEDIQGDWWKNWGSNDPGTNFSKGKGSASNVAGNFLSATLGISAAATISGNLEFEMSNFVRDTNSARRYPRTVSAALSADAEVAAAAQIPILSSIPFPFPTALGGGFKIKATAHFDRDDGLDPLAIGNEEWFGADKIELQCFTKGGEFDYYLEPAHETTLTLDTTPLLTIVKSPAGIVRSVRSLPGGMAGLAAGSFTGLDIKTRLGGVSFGGIHSGFRDRMQTKVPALFKSNFGLKGGLVRTGYIDLHHRVPSELIGGLIADAFKDIVLDRGRGAQEFTQWFLLYLQNGFPPDLRPSSVEKLIAAIDLVRAEIHAEFGAAVAGGFLIKVFGGIRLKLGASGAVVWHQDVTGAVRDLALNGSKSASYQKLDAAGTGAFGFFFDPDAQ